MVKYIIDMYQPILTSIFALILIDFLVFMRALGMYDMSVKSIIKYILEIDIYLIISAVFLLMLANIQNIISFFYKLKE
jgi:hypothetical protein